MEVFPGLRDETGDRTGRTVPMASHSSENSYASVLFPFVVLVHRETLYADFTSPP